MSNMALQEEIHKNFGNKLRVRVCGICLQENKLLLLRHQGIGSKDYLWAPPGGGLQFGEKAEECLVREFFEETGLHIEVVKFLFVNEFFEEPLHAIELFFEVKVTGGNLVQGQDPEMPANKQMIDRFGFLSLEQVKSEASERLHALLQPIKSFEEILGMNGFFRL